MLSFTARGAVRTPEALQLRVGAADAGALRAGAPAPSRPLTDAEAKDNLRFFTTGRDTPRTRPCTHLVLSGCEGRTLDGLPQLARSLGVRRVVLHGVAPPGLLDVVDAVAVRVVSTADVRALPEHRALRVIVPLDAAVLERVPSLVAAAGVRPTARWVFSWPLPGGGATLPPLDDALAVVAAASEGLASVGIAAQVAGLPPCLHPQPAQVRRVPNRYYVDADHQRAAALLFYPDVVELARQDTCRICALASDCDGAPRAWLEAGHLGLLQPIAERRPRG